jgi:hypothetical protein
MTREQAIDELTKIDRDAGMDTEMAHINADDVLCKLLDALGYADVVEAWEKIDKWYS